MAEDDALSAAAIARIEEIHRRVIAQALAILRRIPTVDGKTSTTTSETFAVLANVRQACVSLIREAGRSEVIPVADHAIVAAMDAAAAEAKRSPQPRSTTRVGLGTAGELGGGQVAVAGGPSFSGEARAAIRRATSGALDHVAEAFDVAAQEVRAAVDVGANTPVPLDEIVVAVADRMDVAFVRAEVAVDAAIRGAWRATTFALHESGSRAFDEEAYFVYDNPIDGKTRDFCREHAGKVYSASALAKLDNGQIDPVSVYMGGYGCRGHLAPITRDAAIAEGYVVVD